ncbi:unnamed protein product, partial [Symbiodinium pilosum]
VFIAIVLLLLWSTNVSPQYNLVELFSGEGCIARVYRESGLSAVEYDFIHGRSMNFHSPSGLTLLLILCTSMQVLWIVEQPGSSQSVFSRHWRFEKFCNHICWEACLKLLWGLATNVLTKDERLARTSVRTTRS